MIDATDAEAGLFDLEAEKWCPENPQDDATWDVALKARHGQWWRQRGGGVEASELAGVSLRAGCGTGWRIRLGQICQ